MGAVLSRGRLVSCSVCTSPITSERAVCLDCADSVAKDTLDMCGSLERMRVIGFLTIEAAGLSPIVREVVLRLAQRIHDGAHNAAADSSADHAALFDPVDVPASDVPTEPIP